MQWEDVSWEYHGLWATVIFENPKAPRNLVRCDGRVRCETHNTIATLMNTTLNKVLRPPDWAKVIIHTPKDRDWWQA